MRTGAFLFGRVRYNRAMVATVDLDIVQRILDRDDASMSPEVAKYFLDMHLREADHSRMGELNVKANRGQFTAQEERELDTHLWLCDLLTLVHSKARQSLKARTPAA
jgi:hypothetical protein